MGMKTKYKGEDRKKGLNKKSPFRVVSEDGGGSPDNADVFVSFMVGTISAIPKVCLESTP